LPVKYNNFALDFFTAFYSKIALKDKKYTNCSEIKEKASRAQFLIELGVRLAPE
jgi:hypothetical protein